MEKDLIIKALECCLTLEYGVACKGCPLSYKDERRMDCLELLMKSALSLIKELTEENERLSDRNRTCVYLSDDETKEYCVGLCPAYVTPEEIISDTVRKMQSELKKTFSALCKGEMGDLYRIIDQIAKEIIGDNDD